MISVLKKLKYLKIAFWRESFTTIWCEIGLQKQSIQISQKEVVKCRLYSKSLDEYDRLVLDGTGGALLVSGHRSSSLYTDGFVGVNSWRRSVTFPSRIFQYALPATTADNLWLFTSTDKKKYI
jgi:hypothetical protein